MLLFFGSIKGIVLVSSANTPNNSQSKIWVLILWPNKNQFVLKLMVCLTESITFLRIRRQNVHFCICFPFSDHNFHRRRGFPAGFILSPSRFSIIDIIRRWKSSKRDKLPKPGILLTPKDPRATIDATNGGPYDVTAGSHSGAPLPEFSNAWGTLLNVSTRDQQVWMGY